MKTTFEKIKSFTPCHRGWKKLIKSHNPSSLSNEILIVDIIYSNGVKDAVWALRAIDDVRAVNLFIADIGELALPIYEKMYPGDNRIKNCIEARRKLAYSEISEDDFDIFKTAAYDAAVVAAAAADAAAADAAYDAAVVAAAAAADAAYADAAADAAYADAAAYAAADAAAYAYAAAYAADAAAYAYADAADAAWHKIEVILRKYCQYENKEN